MSAEGETEKIKHRSVRTKSWEAKLAKGIETRRDPKLKWLRSLRAHTARKNRRK